MKKNKFILLVSSLFLLFSCNNNSTIWNKTYKSTGKTFVNWNEKIGNTNKTHIDFIKDNFSNINFDESGYEFYHEGNVYLNPFSELNDYFGFPIDNFDDFKSCIDSWWENDKNIIDPFSSFSGFKENLDKCTFNISLEGQLDGINKGKLVMSFPDPIKEKGIQHDDYYCFDNTPQQKGNYLNLYKDENGQNKVGYIEEVTLFNGEKILRFRTGYYDDSCIDFKFVLKTPIETISTFTLSNYICIKEYKPFPIWGIVLISIGGVAITGFITIFTIKKVKQKKKLETEVTSEEQ